MMGGLDGARRMMERDVIKPKNTWVTISRFLKYIGSKGWLVALVVLLVVLSTYIQVTAPEYSGQVVDCYLSPRRDATGKSACWYTPEDAIAIDARVRADESVPASQKEFVANSIKIQRIGEMVLLLGGMFLVSAVITGAAFYLMAVAGQWALAKIRKDLFQQLHALSLGYYTENEAGNLMSRITSDTDTIAQVLNFGLISVFSGALLLVWLAVKMLTVNVPYALLSMLVVPFMVIATMFFSTRARQAFRKSRKEMGNVNADLQEKISGVREAQAFSREQENIEEFKRRNAANRDANVTAAAYTSALSPVLEALGYVATGIVVCVGGISVLTNTPLLGTSVITLGLVFQFVQYVQRFNQPVQQISVLWTNIQSAIAGAERIFGLMDEKPQVIDKIDAKPMPKIQGDVAFKGVKVGYKEGEDVLKGLSFEAKTGQMVAIVGPTGAGKTTIINLLPRFWDIREGAITIDGVDVRDVKQSSLREQIGIVLQDSFLFSDTVMNNIRYGKLDATDEEVIAAAKLVAADTFIERLPNGYQTVLGERGSGLSQGQRQLISIARAALKDPQILIMDEATSSVDTRTERLIQKALDTLLKGRTSFVIAHRLSTIRNADQVLFVRDGQITEKGTHKTLLELKGDYYNLYQSQFRREEDSEGADIEAKPA
jgi:ATP-binding cassette, subfamily B, multidrug efflux pump